MPYFSHPSHLSSHNEIESLVYSTWYLAFEKHHHLYSFWGHWCPGSALIYWRRNLLPYFTRPRTLTARCYFMCSELPFPHALCCLLHLKGLLPVPACASCGFFSGSGSGAGSLGRPFSVSPLFHPHPLHFYVLGLQCTFPILWTVISKRFICSSPCVLAICRYMWSVSVHGGPAVYETSC